MSGILDVIRCEMLFPWAPWALHILGGALSMGGGSVSEVRIPVCFVRMYIRVGACASGWRFRDCNTSVKVVAH